MSVESLKKDSILLVDDTASNLEILVNFFNEQGFQVSVAVDGESALEQIEHDLPDLILLDVMMPGIDGFETCRRIKANERTADVPVIFMTALSETMDKVKGFSVGGVDYVTKPIQHEEVLARVNTHLMLRSLQKKLQEANQSLEQRVAERTAELSSALSEVEQLKHRLQAENIYLQEEIKLSHNFQEIISQSQEVRTILHQVEQVAKTDATVLILGESGTGKELLARAVHNSSGRADRPLVKVNCAALPTNLIESELFGHEKGAFTGALTRKIGRFELADKGTIFLDEIGDLPLELQAKLLRILQEGEFERLGNPSTMKVDVRVIAATNRQLEQAVQLGEFREDLYYRLNVFPIESPPLRDRKEDIPVLVTHFLKKYTVKIGKPIDTLSKQAMQKLQAYHWPGNVRELENVIERGVILAHGPVLEIGDIPELRIAPSEPVDSAEPTLSNPTSSATLEEVERAHILRVLQETKGVIEGPKGAATILGLRPSTLRSRLQKLGIKITRTTG
jgi:chemotaxis protein methyltransferase CheR